MPQSQSETSPQASSSASEGSERPRWVIVQLSPLGERERDVTVLTKSIHHILGRKIDVFVPAVSQKARGDVQTMFYMDGYVFVRHELGVSYGKLADTAYFAAVLHTPGGLALLDDAALDSMRSGLDRLQASPFLAGQGVRVTEGRFKNLPGEVVFVYDDGKTVQVMVQLRSKSLLIDFPSTYLAPDG